MKQVCVFCGSSPGANLNYALAAKDLGREIARRKLELIYGGSTLGLMGIIAQSAVENGGKVIGVMPRIFEGKVEHPELTELFIVETMHERKAMMSEMADAFIALPGGMGTFEEIMEIVTWSQIGYHSKPCGVLNIDGYFDHLLAQLDQAVQQRFLWPAHRDMLMSDSTAAGLFEQFASYKAPGIEKWRDRK